MAKGEIYPPESLTFQDSETGVEIRQVTTDFSNHHHPPARLKNCFQQFLVTKNAV